MEKDEAVREIKLASIYDPSAFPSDDVLKQQNAENLARIFRERLKGKGSNGWLIN